MYGDDLERRTPRAIRKLLLDYGGKTPNGLPFWRLVRAGDCRILVQGRVHHFPRGVELDLDVRPERIESGRFLMPRYRDITPSFWILQRWFAPHIWGTLEQWKEHRAQEADMPLFAQTFPAAGDYMMIAGPWATPEDAGDLRGAIALYWRQQLANPKDLEAYIRGEMAEEAAERQMRLEEMERRIQAAEAEQAQIWKSTGADAQRYREEMAAKAGLVGHFGASECWG